ncbi:UNVERIFIED_CONTAM: hypothetical protein K2H54_047030 [Gekko kuhli]
MRGFFLSISEAFQPYQALKTTSQAALLKRCPFCRLLALNFSAVPAALFVRAPVSLYGREKFNKQSFPQYEGAGANNCFTKLLSAQEPCQKKEGAKPNLGLQSHLLHFKRYQGCRSKIHGRTR